MSGQKGAPLFTKGADGVNDFNSAKCCICGGHIVVDLPLEPGSSHADRPESFTRFIVDRGLLDAKFDKRLCCFVCLDCSSSGYLTHNLISLKINQAKVKRHERKCVKFYESVQGYIGMLKPLIDKMAEKEL